MSGTDALDPAAVVHTLGRPIPDSPHAVSVAMPTWSDVVGYEEGDPRIHGALACGYPRFVYHPRLRELMARIEARHGLPGEKALPLPSKRVAERCLAFVTANGGTGRLVAEGDLTAVLVPEGDSPLAKAYWQHTGQIVSSRRADAVLSGREDRPDAAAIRQALRERVAGVAGTPVARVSLYPSGMAAIHQALRLIQALQPGQATAQFCFPYLDSLKLQQKLGSGVHFFPMADDADLSQLEDLLASGRLGGVLCELPSNPLMRSFDLPRLSRATRAAGVPLVVDDSIATFYNHDFLPYADVLVSSLTKFFSGTGEAMGGTLVVNPASPLAERLQDAWQSDHEELLFGDDAAVILAGAADFEARMATINRTAEALAGWLDAHPAVAKVHYPTIETPDLYRQALRAHGGYGGMLSFVVKDPERRSAPVYDRLAVNKGPSFGMRTTLACPYTILAHYTELDWAETCGVDRHLIRVSVGLEAPEDLIARFSQALQSGD